MPLLRRPGKPDNERKTLAHAEVHSETNPIDAGRNVQPTLSLESNRDSFTLHRPAGSSADDRPQLTGYKTNETIASGKSALDGQDIASKHHRFSMLRFRNASDSQLSVKAKQQAEKPPPVPTRPPEIITTAPTNTISVAKKRPSRISLATRLRRSIELPRDSPHAAASAGPSSSKLVRKSFTDERGRSSLATLDEPGVPRSVQPMTATTSNATPATAAPRQSESSRSEASSTDPTTPSTTPRKSQSSASFFRLLRNKKQPEPLFGDLGHLPHKAEPESAVRSSSSLVGVAGVKNSLNYDSSNARQSSDRLDGSRKPRVNPATGLFAPTGSRSGQSSPTRANLLRGRSSTLSSLGARDSTDDNLLAPTAASSVPTGRKSFSDMLGLSKLRHNDTGRQGTMTPQTIGSNRGSQSNSFQLTRPPLVTLPEKLEDESPARYLTRVEAIFPRSLIAATLSKGSDSFSMSVLRSYMRSFMFYGDPMDMAIRKLLMEAELPKETQHIDRCLQAFANRYDECNPGIYASADQAYFAAFSLLILHTDVFNKSNKNKMQKQQYLKNTGGQGVFDSVLECFYDNITYTPFIHLDEDPDAGGDRVSLNKSKRKQLLAGPGNDSTARTRKEPIDPYLLILDNNLDALRPNLKEALPLEDCYNYLGTAPSLNLKDLQKTFFRTGVLQIVSARSRPEAFMTDKSNTDTQDAGPGIVDIKITKVGLLWRKDTKKRKTRSPWQEWGAILTGAQLYFFRNVGWIKHLMHQYEQHVKEGNDGIPIIFKPPLDDFKPDSLLSTHDAVALVDTTYKKHKHAFVYVRAGGADEVLLADNEEEMNDWLAKLNYAAAFRTSGVKMRGVLGGNYDGQARRGIRRLDSSEATQLIQTPSGPVSIARSRIDKKMAEDIQTLRRDFMQDKIGEAERKLAVSEKLLDEQLRNARHLQILAPIQAKSRTDLLSAAARTAAQLKLTRMDIWKERCHRDILVQDLNEEVLPAAAPALSSTERGQSAPTISSAHRRESEVDDEALEILPSDSTENKQGRPSSPAGTDSDGPLPSEREFYTPPQSANCLRQALSDASLRDDAVDAERASVSSNPASPDRSVISSRLRPTDSQPLSSKVSVQGEHEQDEVDAGERSLLQQAGLLESAAVLASEGQPSAGTAVVMNEQSSTADRDKADKARLRRSLQRTLREGAGHLSHHRSRKGKDAAPSSTSSDPQRDSMLARGTGSFVVHGKKASVIELGTELQSMSTDETLRERTQGAQRDIASSPAVASSSGRDDHRYELGIMRESAESDRRVSVASMSTSTSRSFGDLHRKFSVAQGARIPSAGANLTVPLDSEDGATPGSNAEQQSSPLSLQGEGVLVRQQTDISQ